MILCLFSQNSFGQIGKVNLSLMNEGQLFPFRKGVATDVKSYNRLARNFNSLAKAKTLCDTISDALEGWKQQVKILESSSKAKDALIESQSIQIDICNREYSKLSIQQRKRKIRNTRAIKILVGLVAAQAAVIWVQKNQ